jgi:hypothetical protein
VFLWLRREFELTIGFIWSSLVVTTNNCNTFKITVIKTQKVSIHTLSLHTSSTNSPWLVLPRTELNCWCYSRYITSARTTQKTHFYCCIRKNTQVTWFPVSVFIGAICLARYNNICPLRHISHCCTLTVFTERLPRKTFSKAVTIYTLIMGNVKWN